MKHHSKIFELPCAVRIQAVIFCLCLQLSFLFPVCDLPACDPWQAYAPVQVIDYPRTPGTYNKEFKIAILMLNTTVGITNIPATRRLEYYTPQELGDIYFTHPYGVKSFITEASYNKYQIYGTVAGWINRPDLDASATTIVLNKDFYFNLFKDYITFSDYDVLYLNAFTTQDGQQTGWVYPQQTITTEQGTTTGIGIDFMINSSVFDQVPGLWEISYWSSGDSALPTTSWAHELIHTFGASGHANSFDCGTNSLAITGTNNPNKAYGNPFSIMGEYAYALHPDAFMKRHIGWLASNQILTVTSSSTNIIYPIETTNADLKALQIPLYPAVVHDQLPTQTYDSLYIEYKDAVGFDRYMVRLDKTNAATHPFLMNYKPDGNVDRNGVLMYLRMESATHQGTVLLDMNPATSYNSNAGIKLLGNAGKFADAILPVGASYDFPFVTSNFSVKVLEKTADGGMKVEVVF